MEPGRATPAALGRRLPLQTVGFWSAAIGVVLAALLGGGGAFVASAYEPGSLIAALFAVIAAALLGGFIVRLGGWSNDVSWGLFGGVALLIALCAVLFALGLVALLVIVAIWIVQAGKRP